jgi:hypothetical protein
MKIIRFSYICNVMAHILPIMNFLKNMVMKKLMLFVMTIVLSASLVFSQKANIPIDEDTGLITWQEVVNESGDKDVLYKRCIEWINSQYKNSQEVTKVRDPEGGRIVVHHRILMVDTNEDGTKINSNTTVSYVLRLEFREERFRYTFTEFTMKATSKFPLERWLNPQDPSYLPKYEGYLVQVEKAILEIIESMKNGMKAKVVKEDNW